MAHRSDGDGVGGHLPAHLLGVGPAADVLLSHHTPQPLPVRQTGHHALGEESKGRRHLETLTLQDAVTDVCKLVVHRRGQISSGSQVLI